MITSTEPNAETHIGSYDDAESDGVKISLGESISATSDSVAIEGTTATITAAGAYEVTGEMYEVYLEGTAGDETSTGLYATYDPGTLADIATAS